MAPTKNGDRTTETFHLGDDFKKDVVTECVEERGGVHHQGEFIEVCEFVCRETTTLTQNGEVIYTATGDPTSTDCPP